MNRKGQTIVEFTLVALLLFTVLFAIVDLSVMFYVNLTMQRAVREGARRAITGQQTGLPGRNDLIQTIKDASNGLYEKNALENKDPEVSVLTPKETRNFSNYTGYRGTPIVDTGQQNDIIIVSLSYAWPLMTPIIKPFFKDGRYAFVARATMKNEPWGNNAP